MSFWQLIDRQESRELGGTLNINSACLEQGQKSLIPKILFVSFIKLNVKSNPIFQLFIIHLVKLMWTSMTGDVKNLIRVKLEHNQDHFKAAAVEKEIVGSYKMKKEKEKKKKIEDQQFSVKQKYQSAVTRWNAQEDLLYTRFLRMNRKYFECENLRRTGKVFMHLSKIMNGARSANQCKSHHQKMQKASKTGGIDDIIQYIEKKHMISKVKQEYTILDPINPDIEEELTDLYRIHTKPTTTCLEIKVCMDPNNFQIW